VQVTVVSLALILTIAVSVRVASAQTASLIDCAEFFDQAEAQRFFEIKGGPSIDPYYLDADNDGIACEPGPAPTPISADHYELCEGWIDYLVEHPDATSSRDRYFNECADYREQTGQIKYCPAYQGLNYRYFSSVTTDQISGLSEMQTGEYESLMALTEGECVPVDVARTSAWQCQALPAYLDSYEKYWSPIPLNPYYHDVLTERYQVVCLGAAIQLNKSRTFPVSYLVGAAVAGAGAVVLYGKYRKPKTEAH
jgi:hypothetical protein